MRSPTTCVYGARDTRIKRPRRPPKKNPRRPQLLETCVPMQVLEPATSTQTSYRRRIWWDFHWWDTTSTIIGNMCPHAGFGARDVHPDVRSTSDRRVETCVPMQILEPVTSTQTSYRRRIDVDLHGDTGFYPRHP